MFRHCSEDEYDEMSEGGTRYLFQLDNYEFRDTLDGHGYLHYFVVEQGRPEPTHYETDHDAMYEFLARYLAGIYEKTHYQMERSPTHAALMDVLEMASARARSGDPDFDFADLEDPAAEAVEDPEDDDAPETGNA